MKMFTRTALSLRNFAKVKPMGRSMGDVAASKQGTMAELPTPNGPWQELYSRNQRKYNLHLLAGITFSVLTVAYVKETGLIPLGTGPKIGN
ncbi:uncharacterized protein COX7B [Panulirus ornatus]|uniref:uncharacterized protein COX7B n=1 Tax=Panulirus ornatus TaxID=150431 RepID=UPI003A894199